MNDALELREIVFTALNSILGLYTFSNGQSVPSLALIANNGEIYPPEGTRVTGLEAVIFMPSLNPTPLLRGHKVREEWVIHLKQWEKGKGIQDALRLFLSAELEDFVVQQTNEVPANYQMGIPSGAQIKLSKFSILGG